MRTRITATYNHHDLTQTVRTVSLAEPVPSHVERLIGLGLFSGLPHDPQHVSVACERYVVARLVLEMDRERVDAVRLVVFHPVGMEPSETLELSGGYFVAPLNDEGIDARGRSDVEALDRLRASLRRSLCAFGEPGDPLHDAVLQLVHGASRAVVEQAPTPYSEWLSVDVFAKDLRPDDVLDREPRVCVVSVEPDRNGFVVVTGSDGDRHGLHEFAMHSVLVEPEKVVGQRVQIMVGFDETTHMLLFDEGDVVDVDEDGDLVLDVRGAEVFMPPWYCRLVRSAAAAVKTEAPASPTSLAADWPAEIVEAARRECLSPGDVVALDLGEDTVYRLVRSTTDPAAFEPFLRAAAKHGRRVRIERRGPFVDGLLANGEQVSLSGVPEVNVEMVAPSVRLHSSRGGNSYWFHLSGDPGPFIDVVTAVHLLDVDEASETDVESEADRTDAP